MNKKDERSYLIKSKQLGGEFSLTPVGERILVKLTPVKEIPLAGLDIPKEVIQENEKKGAFLPIEGTILAIGPEVSSNIKIGDTVYFGKFSGSTFGEDNIKEFKDLKVFLEKEILITARKID